MFRNWVVSMLPSAACAPLAEAAMSSSIADINQAIQCGMSLRWLARWGAGRLYRVESQDGVH